MALKPIFHRILAVLVVSSGALFNVAHAETSSIRAPDTIAARVQACAICHGNQGEGTDNDYFPRLAGKPADYLYNQLKHFREGRRKYAPMNYLVTYLSDDYLREIAVYYANLHPPYPAPEPSNLPLSQLERGRRIALNGDATKNVPACIACHGQALTGIEPAIPGLVGLHADYISAQLGAWRSGIRHATAPDCMHTVAIQLSDTDIRAVSTWLAMQPAPSNAAPAPAGSLTLPLSCGSQPH